VAFGVAIHGVTAASPRESAEFPTDVKEVVAMFDMSAYDVGIRHTVYIDRGHGPSTDYYGYPTLQDLGGLPGLVGLT
jgi:hypothetical protein